MFQKLENALVILTAVLCGHLALAGEVSELHSRSRAESLSLGLSLELPSLSFVVTPKEKSSTDGLRFQPNTAMSYGVGARYRGFGLKASITNQPGADEIARRGRTQSSNITFSQSWKSWSADLLYAVYRGFYVMENSKSISDGETYPTRPDVAFRNLGGNVYYVFSPENYNAGAVQEHGLTDAKNGGSAMALLSVNHLRMSAASPLIQSAGVVPEGSLEGMKGGEFTSLHVGPGYGYSYVSGSNILVAQFLLGLGPQWQMIETPQSRTRRMQFSQKASLSVDYAYELSAWLMGARLKLDLISSNVGSYDLDSTFTSTVLFVSRRF